jgi:hypothetical protein
MLGDSDVNSRRRVEVVCDSHLLPEQDGLFAVASQRRQ